MAFINYYKSKIGQILNPGHLSWSSNLNPNARLQPKYNFIYQFRNAHFAFSLDVLMC